MRLSRIGGAFVTIEMREENGAAPGGPDSYEPTGDWPRMSRASSLASISVDPEPAGRTCVGSGRSAGSAGSLGVEPPPNSAYASSRLSFNA